MTRTWVRQVTLAVTLLLSVVACRELPSHEENGPSAFIDILAAGDSFTAGNGASIENQADYGYYHTSQDDPRPPETIRNKEWTTSLPDPHPYGCFRNHNNYSEELYRLLSSSGSYINAACSGDVTENVRGDVSGYPGQLGGFTAAQANEVDLVTITIGGNDLNFASIVQQCFVGFSNNAEDCQASLDQAISLLAGGSSSSIYGQMRAALNQVANTFPSAQIVLLGYPLLYEDPSLEVADGNVHVFPQPIMETWLDQLNTQQSTLVDELNAETATAGRFAFLPLHQPDDGDADTVGEGFFDGHGIAGEFDPWLNPPGNAAQATFREMWYHPTNQGYEEIASALNDMPFVQDILHTGIRRDFPKMSLIKVDSQWYALDNTGKLWKVTADFVRCQLPNSQYKLVSWKNPEQVFTAATNNAPYPDLPGQPGCNNVPREGDLLRTTSTGGDQYWGVRIGPNGELQRQFVPSVLDGTNKVIANCMLQRGSRLFDVQPSTLATYQNLGSNYNAPGADNCWEGEIVIRDISGGLWVGQSQTSSTVAVRINDLWVESCILQRGIELDHVNFDDPQYNGITLDYSGYLDARCLDGDPTPDPIPYP